MKTQITRWWEADRPFKYKSQGYGVFKAKMSYKRWCEQEMKSMYLKHGERAVVIEQEGRVSIWVMST